MKTVFLPVTIVNQKVGLVAQFHVKSLYQQLEQKIVRLAEVVVKIAKVYADFFHTQ
jgi:hypothetical protein